MGKKQFYKTILHFGSEKTGTTSIQLVCDKNRILLEELGVYYPSGNWHCELASCFSNYPENEITNIVFGNQNLESLKVRDTNYIKNLRNELSEKSGKYLLLSCESFNFLDEQAMSLLREFALEFAEFVEVIYYVRPPISYAISTRSQHVKMGIDSYAPTSDYANRLKKMTAVFGKSNIEVRVFSRETLLQHDVVQDFLSFFTIPSDIAKKISQEIPKENSALSLEGFLVGQKIKEIIADQNLSSIEFMGLYEHKINKIQGQKLYLDEEEIRNVLIKSQQDIEYLESEFGIIFKENLPENPSRKFENIKVIDTLAEFIVQLAFSEGNIYKDHVLVTPELKLLTVSMNVEDSIVYAGQIVRFDIEFVLDRDIEELESGIHVWDTRKWWAFGVNSTLQKQIMLNVAPGIYRISHYLVADLPEGLYTAGFTFTEKLPDGSSNELMWYDKLCEFRVSHPSDRIGVGYANLPSTQMLTHIEPLVKNLITDGTGKIVCNTVVSQMKPSECIELDIEIFNNTDIDWRGDLFRPINLSYHWYDMNDNVVCFDGVRTAIPNGGIPAHGSVSAIMKVIVPEMEGEYCLILTMVQESVGWFEERGFQPFTIDIKVKKD